MPPSLQTYNSVLGRTVRNLEQAQEVDLHHATVIDIVQAPEPEHADHISLRSTNSEMADQTPLSDGPAALAPAAPASDGHAPANLIADLTSSTALLQNLRLRNSILAADLVSVSGSLTRREEKAVTALKVESRSKAKWMAAAACMLAVWATYLWWCWYMRMEFEYIRRRRGEVFGV